MTAVIAAPADTTEPLAPVVPAPGRGRGPAAFELLIALVQARVTPLPTPGATPATVVPGTLLAPALVAPPPALATGSTSETVVTDAGSEPPSAPVRAGALLSQRSARAASDDVPESPGDRPDAERVGGEDSRDTSPAPGSSAFGGAVVVALPYAAPVPAPPARGHATTPAPIEPLARASLVSAAPMQAAPATALAGCATAPSATPPGATPPSTPAPSTPLPSATLPSTAAPSTPPARPVPPRAPAPVAEPADRAPAVAVPPSPAPTPSPAPPAISDVMPAPAAPRADSPALMTEPATPRPAAMPRPEGAAPPPWASPAATPGEPTAAADIAHAVAPLIAAEPGPRPAAGVRGAEPFRLTDAVTAAEDVDDQFAPRLTAQMPSRVTRGEAGRDVVPDREGRIARDSATGAEPASESALASAPAPSAPTTARAAAEVTEPARPEPVRHPVEQIATRLREVNGPGRHEISLRLDPPDLGGVRIDARLDGARLHLQIRAEHAATGEMLADALPRLRETLSQQGFVPADVSVHLGLDASGRQFTPDQAPGFTPLPDADPAPVPPPPVRPVPARAAVVTDGLDVWA